MATGVSLPRRLALGCHKRRPTQRRHTDETVDGRVLLLYGRSTPACEENPRKEGKLGRVALAHPVHTLQARRASPTRATPRHARTGGCVDLEGRKGSHSIQIREFTWATPH